MRTSLKERLLLQHALAGLGISFEDAQDLHRVSMTLHRWFEKECGINEGHIERDEKTQRPIWVDARGPRHYIADAEKRAMERLDSIMIRYPHLIPYIQSDPRGVALYIMERARLKKGEKLDSVYNRGLAIYS